jgi:Bacterial regulatory helix-turn-helix protein, lysR family
VITVIDDDMSTLDIDTVQAFLLVAELQSFTRTAEALGATQAAVSMKLQRLESVVGAAGRALAAGGRPDRRRRGVPAPRPRADGSP